MNSSLSNHFNSLQDTLSSVFKNLSNFNQLVTLWQNYFSSFDFFSCSHSTIFLPAPERVQQASAIGKFEFDKINNLPVFLIQLSDHAHFNERIGKKYQFDIAKHLLKTSNPITNHGLFIFYSSSLEALRISFVHSEFAGTKRSFNYYKRYSFYVDKQLPNTTFFKQFGGCSFSSLDEIKKAFALEPVTKEFYQLLENWYYRALRDVKFPPDAENQPNGRNIQVIRFITRLMFVWFMKAKGIIPEKLFDEKQIKEILIDELQPESSSYYLAILQNLFFATLNTPIEQRQFRRKDKQPGYNPDYMNHGVFRHHALVKDAQIFQQLFKDIPFLNGGLFDCLDMDKKDKSNTTGKEIRIDGFSDKKSKQPIFPNHLLFNEDHKNPGLINILKTFHFTIDENSPIDTEVALDPELLGNIFENLLASYNPETSDTARKATGSFYTPREVVDFMCQQAILQHLHTQTKLDLETLEELISFSEDPVKSLTKNEKETLVYTLLNTKILDPACGSGAFPMGILHRMVWILQKIDPDGSLFKEIKLAPLKQVQQNIVDIQSNAELHHLFEQIKQKLQEKTDDYNRKLHLIENCIYGVDIQPIAVQIAKLRFFISLLVDEQVDKNKPNANMHPLPNLDMKFIVANTLIGLPSTTSFVAQFLDDLRQLMHRYFECHTLAQKESIRQEFYALRNKIHQHAISWGDKELTDSIQHFDPFNTDVSHQWFDPLLMFGIKDGFDIVIGNPPYINVEKIDATIKSNISRFRTAYQKYDIYVLFYEKGIDLLKPNGQLIFITSNKFLSQGYGLLLRREFLKYHIKQIINFNYDIFETATVRTCIFHLHKTNTSNNSVKIIDVASHKDSHKFKNLIFNYLDQNIFNSTEENNFRINLTNDKIEILKKIIRNTIRLEEICSVNYGLRPIPKDKNLSKDIFIKKRYNEGLKYYFEGKDMGNWTIKDFSYIDYKPDLMYNPMFPELFENPKLAGLCTLSDIEKLRFIYDNSGAYTNHSVAILTLWHLFSEVKNQTIQRNITPKKIRISKNFNYFYLQGILNSRLIKFYVNELLYDGTHFYPNHMKSLPIKDVSFEEQKPIINIVENIHNKLKEDINSNVTDLEKQINKLVYALYELTEEEVRIVEKELKMK